MNRLIKFIFRTSFSSITNYLFIFILPIILFSFSYLIMTSFGTTKITNFQKCAILGLTIIGPITTLMPISKIILDWRESILIKQFKIFEIKKWQVILGLWILSLVFCFITYISMFIMGSFIDLFLINKNFIKSISLLQNIEQYIAILFIITFLSFFVFIISFIVSFLLKKILLIQTINLFIIIYFMVFSDVFDPNLNSNNAWISVYNLLGTINPIKSIQWLLFSSYVNLGINLNNIRYIIYSTYIDIPFTFGTSNPILIIPMSMLQYFVLTGAMFSSLFFIKMNSL
ncbi:hypothetical protein [Spiroplasma culicicola]|uniref:Uncharacterized protein n=1 Tax=Spiroplasma culicicola AES-1 TaxID=1276246 RepID=W6AHZ0_9MOLU|nr:hypothetical protein [Spiroplasma culicicola]AHI53314.1 hypothetical protein SCULI_v1c09740 [Spiroplasma culicicola AES-1]